MVDDKTVFLVLKDGTVYPIELFADGKTISRLSISPALAQTTIPAVVKRVDEDHVFIGSTVGPSILLKALHVEQEIGDGDGGVSGGGSAAAVVQDDVGMDDDDDDGMCLSFSFERMLRI